MPELIQFRIELLNFQVEDLLSRQAVLEASLEHLRRMNGEGEPIRKRIRKNLKKLLRETNGIPNRPDPLR